MTRVLTTIFSLAVCLSVAHGFERDIAVLWDSSEADAKSYSQSLVHRKLEVILNHYGYKATYFDVQDKATDSNSAKPEDFHALITWFSDDETKNVKDIRKLYRNWFRSTKKVLSLGQLGIFYDDKDESYDLKDINNTLKLVDLEFEDIQYESPLGLKANILVDPSIVEFERNYKYEVPAVKVFKSLNNNNEILVSIEDTINKRTSPVVIKNNKFFMVHAGLDLFNNPQKSVTQWRINPFYLVKWIQADKYKPIPDTTTINGKRIFYSHVDGDAFINISDIDRKSISGEILLKEVLDVYKVPTTISYVVAEIDQAYLGKANYLETAKEIASKEYVELATHTYFHPLSWEKSPPQYEVDAYLDDPAKYKGGPILAYQPKDKQLSYEREIHESIDYINSKIAPKGKETNFVLWSGSCSPNVEAMKVVKKYNYLNMNGGDSRFDKKYPSYSHLLPLYKSVDGLIQYYSSNTNEIPYTSNWTGPFSGFTDVIETFKNTETPIRLKPINIYYHFYSAEKKSSLNALKTIYDWVEEQDSIPVFTSKYPGVLNGFINSKVSKVQKEYKVSQNGELKTYRIDEENVYPSYIRSKNVIGHRRINGSLYIFLGSDEETTIGLRKTPPKELHISWSDYIFTKTSLNKDKVYLKGSSNKYNKIKLYIGENRKLVQNSAFKTVNYDDGYATIEFKSNTLDLTIELLK